MKDILISIYAIIFFQAEDGIRDGHVTGVQTCALPISHVADSSIPAPVLPRCPTPISATAQFLPPPPAGAASSFPAASAHPHVADSSIPARHAKHAQGEDGPVSRRSGALQPFDAVGLRAPVALPHRVPHPVARLEQTLASHDRDVH